MSGRDSGYTLLELLVGLALLSLLALALAPALRLGGRAWDAGHRSLDEAARVESAQDFLRRGLAAAVPFQVEGERGKRVAFEGNETSMTFVGPMPPYLAQGAWNVVRVELRAEGGGKNLVAAWDGFEPRSGRLGLGPGTREAVLAEGVAAVTFSYFPRAADERSAWLAAWDDEKTLPGLVRVRVEFPRESGRSWSELVLRPMVDVPPMTGG